MRHLKKIRDRPCMYLKQEEAKVFTEVMDGAASQRWWASNLLYWSPGGALPITVYPVQMTCFSIIKINRDYMN